jgi:hypothetical protein
MNIIYRLSRYLRRFKKEPVGEKKQLYSIGIFTGKSPIKLSSPSNNLNPVLSRNDISDVKALFVADPFMIKLDNIWYMFFEIYNGLTWKGEIGVAKSENAHEWVYQSVVLSESFHMSYPYVFSFENEFYMIPESANTFSIRLYRAKSFPFEWEFIGNLLSEQRFADSSVVYHNKKWWLFTETNPDLKHDTLKVFYSESLRGRWKEHPFSPVVQGDPHIARPAGRLISCGDRLIRYAQDCYPVYGTQVRSFEVRISSECYEEKQVGADLLLGPSGAGWNGNGMHHVDPHPLADGGWVACVDGWQAVNSLG